MSLGTCDNVECLLQTESLCILLHTRVLVVPTTVYLSLTLQEMRDTTTIQSYYPPYNLPTVYY